MKRHGEILTKFLLAVSMLLAVQTAKAQKEQPDTLQGEQLDEVVVTSRSARQRFEQVQIGVEQVQMSEVQRLRHSSASTTSCAPCSCCQA